MADRARLINVRYYHHVIGITAPRDYSELVAYVYLQFGIPRTANIRFYTSFLFNHGPEVVEMAPSAYRWVGYGQLIWVTTDGDRFYWARHYHPQPPKSEQEPEEHEYPQGNASDMELARRQAPLLGNGEVVRRGSVRRLTPRVVHQNPDPRLDPLSAEFVPGSSGGSDDNHTAGHMANGNASYRATVAAGVTSPSEQSKGGGFGQQARSNDGAINGY